MPSKLKRPTGSPIETVRFRASNGGRLSVIAPSPDRARVFVRHVDDSAAVTRIPSESVDAQIWLVCESCHNALVASRFSPAELTAMKDAVKPTWEQLNQRRLALIDKDIDHGLSAAETAELADLEKKAQQYLDATAPVSFEIINRLKQCAARDGLTVELD